jgi:GMP synthase (glutamine-hydrolysing)
LDNLRKIDAIVTDTLKKTGEYGAIWQMPVIILPLVNEKSGNETIVLRPIHSKDAMDAKAAMLKRETLDMIVKAKQSAGGIGDLLLDVTPKPPATIEWE